MIYYPVFTIFFIFLFSSHFFSAWASGEKNSSIDSSISIRATAENLRHMVENPISEGTPALPTSNQLQEARLEKDATFQLIEEGEKITILSIEHCNKSEGATAEIWRGDVKRADDSIETWVFKKQKKRNLYENSDIFHEATLMRYFYKDPDFVQFVGVVKEDHNYVLITRDAGDKNLYEYINSSLYKMYEGDKKEFKNFMFRIMKKLRQKGIIYGDFKTNNIVVEKKFDVPGGRLQFTLIDLGYSTSHWINTCISGTFEYFAPEILHPRSEDHIPTACKDSYEKDTPLYETSRADDWSFAITLLEVLYRDIYKKYSGEAAGVSGKTVANNLAAAHLALKQKIEEHDSTIFDTRLIAMLQPNPELRGFYDPGSDLFLKPDPNQPGFYFVYDEETNNFSNKSTSYVAIDHPITDPHWLYFMMEKYNLPALLPSAQ